MKKSFITSEPGFIQPWVRTDIFILRVIFHAFVGLLTFFSKLILKKSFRTLSVSNGLDPDQDRNSVLIWVSPDLGPNCLNRLSADGKSHSLQGKS